MHSKRVNFLLTAFLMSFLFFSSASADELNQRSDFFVNSVFDKYQRTSLTATLRHMGSHLYVYVDDGYWNGLNFSGQNSLRNAITSLADEFDNNIYPKQTAFWGSEPNPGIDGDPRVTVLLEELTENHGGYFDTANLYSRDEADGSNQREMIALNVEILISDIEIPKMFLAHEFQHLISFNQKEKTHQIAEDVWLNELRSEYAITAAGYNDIYSGSNLSRRAYVFSTNFDDSLTEWPNKNADYGMAAVFAEYLAEQFGQGILAETIKYPQTGIYSINKYLENNNYYERFEDIFLNWLGALYLNDNSVNSKLGYQRPELKNIRITPQQKIFLSQNLREYNASQNIKDWQPLWIEFDLSNLPNDPANSVQIDVGGETGQNFAAAYLAFYDSGAVELGKINASSGQGRGFILNDARRLRKVVVLAAKTTKASGFTKNEFANQINVKASLIDSKTVQARTLKDGALIKRPYEKEIYVIWGKYKRYLNPAVIGLYGHLDPNNAIELDPEMFNSYQTANYVKYINDEKVYAVWPDGTKHWLNITPQQWDASHRDWNAIFVINERELNYYKIGGNITR